MVDFEVQALTPTVGAQIVGFDADAELDDETCRVLRDTLDRAGVLLFRDLDVDLDQHTRLCRMLIGEPYWEPPAPSKRDGVYYVSNKEPDSGAATSSSTDPPGRCGRCSRPRRGRECRSGRPTPPSAESAGLNHPRLNHPRLNHAGDQLVVRAAATSRSTAVPAKKSGFRAP